MERICLDTDFLVNALRGGEAEIAFIEQHEDASELATTHITLFELYYGAYKSKRQKENVKAVTELIGALTLLNLSQESVKKAGELLAELEKEGMPIDFRDLFIGTIALTNGFSLKTSNKRHFERIEGLRVV